MYLLPISQSVTIDHVVPLVFYTGAYAIAPLTDASAGPWTVSVRVFMSAVAAASGTLTVSGSWGGSASSPVTIAGPTANTSVIVNITVPVGGVSLWWPVDVGAHTLYTVTANLSLNTGAQLLANRSIGFRALYLVTANVRNEVWLHARAL